MDGGREVFTLSPFCRCPCVNTNAYICIVCTSGYTCTSMCIRMNPPSDLGGLVSPLFKLRVCLAPPQQRENSLDTPLFASWRSRPQLEHAFDTQRRPISLFDQCFWATGSAQNHCSRLLQSRYALKTTAASLPQSHHTVKVTVYTQEHIKASSCTQYKLSLSHSAWVRFVLSLGYSVPRAY